MNLINDAHFLRSPITHLFISSTQVVSISVEFIAFVDIFFFLKKSILPIEKGSKGYIQFNKREKRKKKRAIFVVNEWETDLD